MYRISQEQRRQHRMWVETCCWPISAALREGDLPAAYRALANAWNSALAQDHDPGLADTHLVACTWHEFLAIVHEVPPAQFAQVCSDFLLRLTETRWTAWAEESRRKVCLCARLIAATEGVGVLHGEEIRTALARIENVDRSVFVWHYITPWAYFNRDIGLLRRAYEALAQNQHVQDQHESYKRVALLYSLLTGTATSMSVNRYAKFLKSQADVLEFIGHIYPDCELQGLVNEDLRSFVRIKRDLLNGRAIQPTCSWGFD